jgi:hypothetical protein
MKLPSLNSITYMADDQKLKLIFCHAQIKAYFHAKTLNMWINIIFIWTESLKTLLVSY